MLLFFPEKYIKSFIVSVSHENLPAKEGDEEGLLESGTGRTIRTDVVRSLPRHWFTSLDPEYVA